jgi:hypothetical protein
MPQEVWGMSELLAKIDDTTDELVRRVVEGTEKSAVDVQNHAKAHHEPGFAHAVGRYENDTVQLTNSITPGDPVKKGDEIVVEVAANKEYAANVELGGARRRAYPFMLPALMANKKKFKERLRESIYGR